MLDQIEQALWIMQQQVGAFVGGEAAGKTQGQNIGVEPLLTRVDLLQRCSMNRSLTSQMITAIVQQCTPGPAADIPEVLITEAAQRLLGAQFRFTPLGCPLCQCFQASSASAPIQVAR